MMGAKSSGLFSSFKIDSTKKTSGRSREYLMRKGWRLEGGGGGGGWGGGRFLSKKEKKKEKTERDVQQHDAKTTLKQRRSVFSRITSIFKTGGQR